tara:strand:+ start:1054 stop:1446 length:393 start_codon:yes stop_codon:yes gene_type:complete
MANVVTSQTILDGDRNLVILLTGTLDTSNEARTVKVDVSTFVPAPTRIRVDTIRHLISPGLIVVLDWDATTPVRFAALTGYDEIEACKFGGLQDNSGTGRTGDIYLTTLGYSSGTLAYTIILEMTKTSFS